MGVEKLRKLVFKNLILSNYVAPSRVTVKQRKKSPKTHNIEFWAKSVGRVR